MPARRGASQHIYELGQQGRYVLTVFSPRIPQLILFGGRELILA